MFLLVNKLFPQPHKKFFLDEPNDEFWLSWEVAEACEALELKQVLFLRRKLNLPHPFEPPEEGLLEEIFFSLSELLLAYEPQLSNELQLEPAEGEVELPLERDPLE
ncbi:MAG: hypothetical protein ACFNX1_01410 [Treponema lecithinolyticum]|uniref:hypothetical protein n=1 Tax=Treponema lecithinolyticum TaxID=53418 RepID=UPI003609A4EE